MHAYISLYIAALFVALTPGILVTLPKGGSKIKVAIAHGLIFTAVLYFSYEPVLRSLRSMERFQSGGSPAMPIPAATGSAAPMPGGVPALPIPAASVAGATVATGGSMLALPGGMTVARKPESTRSTGSPPNTSI